MWLGHTDSVLIREVSLFWRSLIERFHYKQAYLEGTQMSDLVTFRCLIFSIAIVVHVQNSCAYFETFNFHTLIITSENVNIGSLTNYPL